MVVHTTYALINEGKILNHIICSDYTEANDLAHAIFGYDAFAVETTQYPIQEGDLYVDGHFYRENEDGEIVEIPRMPTDREEIDQAISELQEKASTEEVTDLQMALAEVYEMILGGI